MYEIRLATAADLEDLIQVRMAFLKEVGSLNADVDRSKLETAIRDYFRRKMPTGEFLIWLAVSEAKIIGTGGISLFERPPNGLNMAGMEAYLSNMYTVPAWRGKGVGTALISAVIGHMKETCVKRIWLQATDQGRPIYEKAGFVTSITDMELAWK